MADCPCTTNWRVLCIDANDASFLGEIIPQSFEFQTNLNEPGTGSLRFSRYVRQDPLDGASPAPALGTDTVPIQLVYPRRTILYFLRVNGQGATRQNPVIVFAGLVQSLTVSLEGLVTVGFDELDIMLEYSVLNLDRTYNQVQQTQIAADVANTAMKTDPNSVIFATANTTARLRDRVYEGSDYKNGAELITNLINVIDGVSYHRSFITNEDQGHFMRLVFHDNIAPIQDEVATITAGDVSDFRLNVDANEQYQQLYALGAEPEEEGQTRPETDAFRDDHGFAFTQQVVTWDTVINLPALQENADGWIDLHADAVGGISFALDGLDFPQLMGLQPGFRVDVKVQGTGLSFWSSDVFIDSVAWAVRDEGVEKIRVQASALDITSHVWDSDAIFPPKGCVDC